MMSMVRWNVSNVTQITIELQPSITADTSRDNREPADEHPLKKTMLRPTAVLDAATLFDRPFSEPPIFSYDLKLEVIEQKLKDMREKLHLFDPDMRFKMDLLDWHIDFHLAEIYNDWAFDMYKEAKAAGNDTAKAFFDGLLDAVIEDNMELIAEGWKFPLMRVRPNVYLNARNKQEGTIEEADVEDSGNEGYSTADKDLPPPQKAAGSKVRARRTFPGMAVEMAGRIISSLGS